MAYVEINRVSEFIGGLGAVCGSAGVVEFAVGSNGITFEVCIV